MSGRHFNLSGVGFACIFSDGLLYSKHLPPPSTSSACIIIPELVLILFRIHSCSLKGSSVFAMKCSQAGSKLAH